MAERRRRRGNEKGVKEEEEGDKRVEYYRAAGRSRSREREGGER